MKYRSSLPNKLKCHKLFEVEDQINHVLLIYDESVDRQQFLVTQQMGNFWSLFFQALMFVIRFFYSFLLNA